MAIFAYQAYWLVSMYHTMKSDMEHSIIEAMRTSDYNEMMLRIERMRRKVEHWFAAALWSIKKRFREVQEYNKIPFSKPNGNWTP